MNLDITNENLYLLLPCKISRVVQIYAHEHNLSLIEAMRCFYYSNTYKRLADESTKLWHYGPVALYQEFNLWKSCNSKRKNRFSNLSIVLSSLNAMLLILFL